MTQFEHFFSIVKKPWVTISYGILVFLAYHYIDRPLALYCHDLDLGTLGTILNKLTLLGTWIFYVAGFAFLGLYFRYANKNRLFERRAWFLFSCLALSSLAAFVLKVCLSRARPDLLFENNLFGFFGFKLDASYWSFPSGHTVTVVALAAGLGVLFPKYFYSVLLVAFLVIMTRVLLCFHYLSDVMIGCYLSILIPGFIMESCQRRQCLPN